MMGDSDNEEYLSMDEEENQRNFNDYEALLNLDEHIVHAVPDKLLQLLPCSKYTEGNKANFSEENKFCTICMC